MELTPEHVAAAEACGCTLVPATDEQVRRLAVQRRIFRVGGQPFVATRGGGFFETWATLAVLIEKHRPIAPERSAETGAAPAPEHVAPSDAGPPSSALPRLDVAEAEPNGRDPAALKPLRPKAPRPKSAPTNADAVPNGETAAEPSKAEEMLAKAGAAAQGRGPGARVIGRRRAGQPTPPRWTIAGKMRRGRLR